VPRGGFELTFELDLSRPPGSVFDLIADPGSFKRVDPAMVDFGPPGPLVEGSTGWFRHRRGPVTARTTFTVTALEAPRHIEVEIAGMGYGMTESATLEATLSGTHATFVDRVWPTTLAGRALVALSAGIMRRDLRARSARLQALLEGPGRSAA
jgi:uncharacterized protein YndB with AHSA1/START domain